MNTKNLGTLLGGAYGDALGYPGEFFATKQARKTVRQVEWQLNTGTGLDVLISDDTQLTMAVGRVAALRTDAAFMGSACYYTWSDALIDQFVRWNRSPANNRAPGFTCTSVCKRLATGLPWQLATDIRSKGNGANMRVAPVGLLNESQAVVGGFAQLQAAITHGHPTALAASELTALAVWYLKRDMKWEHLLHYLELHVAESWGVYREEWLGNLWRRKGASKTALRRDYVAAATDSGEWIARGWAECRKALTTVRRALEIRVMREDPCRVLHTQGNCAEDALALALYCCTSFPDDPVAALRYAAISSGDSDSIATLVGSFMGARYGAEAFPAKWATNIEHRREFRQLAAKLS